MRGLVFLHVNQLHKTLLTLKKSKIPIGIIFVALLKKGLTAIERFDNQIFISNKDGGSLASNPQSRKRIPCFSVQSR